MGVASPYSGVYGLMMAAKSDTNSNNKNLVRLHLTRWARERVMNAIYNRKEVNKTKMDFINQVSIACANMLIADAKHYINVLYELTAEKCINLFLPNHTEYNIEIIERELKNTQEFFFDYLQTCEYALEKCQIMQLKKLSKEEKHKIRLLLYDLIGKEVKETDEN